MGGEMRIGKILRMGAGIAVGGILLWFIGDGVYAWRVGSKAKAADAPRSGGATETLHRGGEPAVLMIHGFADGPAIFEYMGPALADQGMEVRLMRLEGFGGTLEEAAQVTLEAWRRDIDAEIAGLKAEMPSREVWLVGHSLGGTLAFDAALRPENGVAGLLLLAPFLEASRTRSPVLAPRRWFEILDRLLVFTQVIESILPRDIHNPEMRGYVTDRYLHRALYRALFAATDAIQGRAADWHGPLWMCIATEDLVVDSRASERFFFAATNAQPARLVSAYAAGHVLPLDYGWERLAERMGTFIRGEAGNSAVRDAIGGGGD